MMFDVLGNCISQVISDLDRYSGSPFHKDHVPLKVEVVVIPKPIHHIQQCLLVNVGKFNQQHTDVNLVPGNCLKDAQFSSLDVQAEKVDRWKVQGGEKGEERKAEHIDHSFHF